MLKAIAALGALAAAAYGAYVGVTWIRYGTDKGGGDVLLDDHSSIARKETRVQTTDSLSRARFRRYWTLLSPGMDLIRIILLQQLKSDAEGARKDAARG